MAQYHTFRDWPKPALRSSATKPTGPGRPPGPPPGSGGSSNYIYVELGTTEIMKVELTGAPKSFAVEV